MAGADLPREPPPEAERQADDTYTLSLEDGSTVRWTRRQNGSWRPPERTRAGWVGELERPKYVTPALRAQQEHPAGHVPGLPPPEPAAPSKARPAARPMVDQPPHQQQFAGSVPGMTPQDVGHAPGMPPQEAEPAAKAKRKPGRRKPIGEAKQAERPASQPGRLREEPRHEPPQHSLRLLENAVQGLRKDAEVRTFKALPFRRAPEERGPEVGAPAAEAHPADPASRQPFAPPQRRHEPPQALLASDDGDLPIRIVDGELADAVDRLRIEDSGRRRAAAATPALVQIRERKAILKKLRQIQELEEKQARGEELNEDQLAKLRSRGELQSALQG